MDIALEWEWDNKKVAAEFPFGDFRKLLEVDAACGLAIVQTRTDHKRGSTQADETVGQLRQMCKQYRQDNRSIALIEIRRVLHQRERVDFVVYFQDLDIAARREIARWSYS
jgi:hypothetical protein